MTKDQTKQLREQYQKTNSVNPYLLQNLLDDWERYHSALEKIIQRESRENGQLTLTGIIAQNATHPEEEK